MESQRRARRRTIGSTIYLLFHIFSMKERGHGRPSPVASLGVSRGPAGSLHAGAARRERSPASARGAPGDARLSEWSVRCPPRSTQRPRKWIIVSSVLDAAHRELAQQEARHPGDTQGPGPPPWRSRPGVPPRQPTAPEPRWPFDARAPARRPSRPRVPPRSNTSCHTSRRKTALTLSFERQRGSGRQARGPSSAPGANGTSTPRPAPISTARMRASPLNGLPACPAGHPRQVDRLPYQLDTDPLETRRQACRHPIGDVSTSRTRSRRRRRPAPGRCSSRHARYDVEERRLSGDVRERQGPGRADTPRAPSCRFVRRAPRRQLETHGTAELGNEELLALDVRAAATCSSRCGRARRCDR